MTASSRYTRAVASEVGDIERRLRVLQSGVEKLRTRVFLPSASDAAEGLSGHLAYQRSRSWNAEAATEFA